MLIHEDEAAMIHHAERWCSRWGGRLYAYMRKGDPRAATSTLSSADVDGWRVVGHFDAPLTEQGPAFRFTRHFGG